jgi:hypothetical protein
MSKHLGKKSQVSLEMALAVFLSILLVAGILRVFIWVNARVVMLQQDYDKNRGLAGSAGPGGTPVVVNEENFPKLDILGNNALYQRQ